MSTCNNHCSCNKCAATKALNRVIYARRERSRYKRIQRILYDSRVSNQENIGHYGGWIPRWRPRVTPAEFIAARNSTKYPGYLTPLEESDIKDHHLILSHDGKVGAALSPEGDIQNVFNNNGPKGAGAEAILETMRHGGHTLDAFDHFLPVLYSQFGFKETGRMKFNRDYAPPGWDYQKHGEPDVVFMSRSRNEPIHEDIIRQRVHDKSKWQANAVTGKYFDDWDRAKSHSRGMGVYQSHDPVEGSGVGGTTLGIPAGERQGSGLPLTMAEQGHTQSLDPGSPVHDVARKIMTLVPAQQEYQDVLNRIRSKSS